MNAAQAEKWRKTRTMGKGKYVMLFGVLSWGISLAALFTAIEWLTQQTFTPYWVYIRLGVMAVVGFFVANFRWESREQKLRQLEQPQAPKKR
ncbi:hypothetical protein ACHHV8_24495 [Paenibacillus sp. TAB 01]|uniref:hypothetical protein n=1 Tax=Paenibacillus sp. TAB 01 TaxID=3368988 RepID=UPI003753358D